jgi:hypothetical protein
MGYVANARLLGNIKATHCPLYEACQSRLGRANHALAHVAHVTTAALSLGSSLDRH